LIHTNLHRKRPREDLEFGLQKGVDMVAISFVRCAQDILTIREAIEEFAKHPKAAKTPIIAKLERPEALDDLEGIMEVTDGVMVAGVT
jgi:pyruvate kinase